MPYFRYRAVDSEGKYFTGILEATEAFQVEDSLSTSGFHLISLKRVNPLFAQLLKRLWARKVKRRDIIEFSSNLSVMLRAGIPLLEALNDISATVDNKYFKEKIAAIQRMVQMGSTFSGAVALHGDVFPDIFIRLVAVGEETGGLDRSLKDIADHLERLETLASAIKRALLYPIFAIIATVGALLFWLTYVLPKIITLFKDMDIPLPFTTRMLMAMSDFTTTYWYLILLIPVLMYVALQFLKRYKSVRYALDDLKLKMPIVKLIVHNKTLALFSEQMRILIVAGLTIDRILDLLASVIGNEVVRRAIIETRDAILAGSSITAALKQHKVFPSIVIRMINVGEQTGNLDEQFAFLSDHFIAKLDDVTQKIGKMLEPIVIGVIGVFFLLIILGLMVPIYNLISKVS